MSGNSKTLLPEEIPTCPLCGHFIGTLEPAAVGLAHGCKFLVHCDCLTTTSKASSLTPSVDDGKVH